ncbi:MAG: ferrochelatase [Verrucomicrobiota bacterium]
MPQKTAVLMFNLGSPDSTSVPDVRRYLKEFLLDGRVIDAPAPIRNLVVRGFILPFRPKNSAEAYSRIWTDEGSPLILISQQQQQLLQKASGQPVYLCMRYGNPSTPDVIRQIQQDDITHLYIIPLYPHYSMASYETGLVAIEDEIRDVCPELTYSVLDPYYNDPGYIHALATQFRPYVEKDFDMLVFSFHGIPERHLRKSDPSHAHCLTCEDCCDIPNPAHATCYRHQCLETARLVRESLGIPAEKFRVTFQSRLGRDPWLQPYTDLTLEKLPENHVKKLIIACPAFVADCLETLEEIAMEGREIFMEAGGESYDMVPCLNDSPIWIDYLNGKVAEWKENLHNPANTAQMQYYYEKKAY